MTKSKRTKSAPPALPMTVASAAVGDSGGGALAVQDAVRAGLVRHMRECTDAERAAAELFCVYRNKTRAWREAFGIATRPASNNDYIQASQVFSRPWVLAYVRECELSIAAGRMLDIQAILDRDRAIVEAADHANDLSRIVYACCRHCYGTEHKYQWKDVVEYLDALRKVAEKNEERRELKLRELPLPSDEGGFGYDPNNDPNMVCPQCEGRGERREIFADTTKLGPAAALYRGIRVKGDGSIEILQHDVDKAKERLLRAAGVFKDDAASVARGAAAGAAAGMAAATAAAARQVAEAPMTSEQAQKLYLELAQ